MTANAKRDIEREKHLLAKIRELAGDESPGAESHRRYLWGRLGALGRKRDNDKRSREMNAGRNKPKSERIIRRTGGQAMTGRLARFLRGSFFRS